MRFADDVVIFAETKNNLENIRKYSSGIAPSQLKNKSRKNHTKIKLINVHYKESIKIRGKAINKVEGVEYLRQTISFKNTRKNKINKRITKGWKKYWVLEKIFKTNFKNILKSAVFNICLIPAISNGSQTWALKKIDIQ